MKYTLQNSEKNQKYEEKSTELLQKQVFACSDVLLLRTILPNQF